MYADSVKVTVNWKEGRLVEGEGVDESGNKKPSVWQPYSFKDLFDPTRKYPGVAGTYSFTWDAAYHLLNGKIGLKLVITSINVDPDESSVQNPLTRLEELPENFIPMIDTSLFPTPPETKKRKAEEGEGEGEAPPAKRTLKSENENENENPEGHVGDEPGGEPLTKRSCSSLVNSGSHETGDLPAQVVQ